MGPNGPDGSTITSFDCLVEPRTRELSGKGEQREPQAVAAQSSTPCRAKKPATSVLHVVALRWITDMVFPMGRTCRRLRSGLRIARVPSFDDVIRAQQQRRWDPEADGLGGPEVDDELEFRRALHRQIARLSPLEDPVHITGGAPKRIEEGG